MITPKTIAVIDAAGRNAAITGRIAGPYRIVLTPHDTAVPHQQEDSISRKKDGTDVVFAENPRKACWEADIIILPANHPALGELAKQIGEVSVGKVVICLAHEDAASARRAVEIVKPHLPYSRTVAYALSAETSLPADTTEPWNSDFVEAANADALDEATRLLRAARAHPAGQTASAPGRPQPLSGN